MDLFWLLDSENTHTDSEESSTDSSEAEEINGFNEWKAAVDQASQAINTELQIHLDNVKKLGQRQLSNHLVFGYIRNINKQLLFRIPFNINKLCFLFFFYDFEVRPFKEYDKNAPELPSSPWYIFRDQRRTEIKTSHVKQQHIDDEIMKEWFNLSKKQNKIYYTLYRQQIVIYKSDLCRYKRTVTYRVFKRELAEWRQWHAAKLYRDMIRRQNEERIAREDPNWKAKQLQRLQKSQQIRRDAMKRFRNNRENPQ